MAKFGTLELGRAPTKRVKFPLCSSEVEVGLRVLSARERTTVYQAAKAAAKAAGVETWDENDPVCALELYVETIAAAAFDVDDEEERAPFATAEELRESNAIGQEVMLFLHQAYEALEQTSGPRLHELAPKQLYDLMWSLVNRDFDPLARLPLATQWNCMHSMAVLALNLSTEKSLNSRPADSAEPSTSSSSSKP